MLTRLLSITMASFMLSVASATHVTAATAHDFDDDDDIYYSPSKAKKQKEELDKQHTAQLKKLAQQNSYNYTTVPDYPGAEQYKPASTPRTDIDSYNRRGIFADANQSQQDTTVASHSNFEYTRTIERFYNPDIIVENPDMTVSDLYYSTPAEPNTTVNLYIQPSIWGYSPWGYSTTCAYDPWYWGSYYPYSPASRWYWSGYYPASWSWGWGYPYPGWGWTYPSYGWTYPSHSWGHSYHRPANGSWSRPGRPVNSGNISNREPSHSRPGQVSASNGLRPGTRPSGSAAPSYGTGSGSGTRPSYSSGYRPGSSTSGYRQGAQTSIRPGSGSAAGSSSRPSSSSYRNSSSSNSNHTPSYRSSSSYSPSSSSSYRSGSYSGSRSSYSGSASRSSGGGRGRH